MARSFLLLMFALLAGCAAAPVRPAAHPVNSLELSNTDPCAMQLHDLSGDLLMYYQQHFRLPPTLETLKSYPDVTLKELSCPVSHQPYVYNADGLAMPGLVGRLVLYDASPVHDGARWAVEIIPPKNRQPMIANVVAIPEARFPKTPAQ